MLTEPQLLRRIFADLNIAFDEVTTDLQDLNKHVRSEILATALLKKLEQKLGDQHRYEYKNKLGEHFLNSSDFFYKIFLDCNLFYTLNVEKVKIISKLLYLICSYINKESSALKVLAEHLVALDRETSYSYRRIISNKTMRSSFLQDICERVVPYADANLFSGDFLFLANFVHLPQTKVVNSSLTLKQENNVVEPLKPPEATKITTSNTITFLFDQKTKANTELDIAMQPIASLSEFNEYDFRKDIFESSDNLEELLKHGLKDHREHAPTQSEVDPELELALKLSLEHANVQENVPASDETDPELALAIKMSLENVSNGDENNVAKPVNTFNLNIQSYILQHAIKQTDESEKQHFILMAQTFLNAKNDDFAEAFNIFKDALQEWSRVNVLDLRNLDLDQINATYGSANVFNILKELVEDTIKQITRKQGMITGQDGDSDLEYNYSDSETENSQQGQQIKRRRYRN